MKKAMVFVLVVLLAVGSVFAATYRGASQKDSFSLGLNLGTNNGVILNYGMGKFDLEGIIGFGILNGTGLTVEVAGNYEIVDVAESAGFKGQMPFTFGLEGAVDLHFNDFAMGVGVLVPLKLAYTFPKVPCTLYLRVAPGVRMAVIPDFSLGFGIEGSIGATYNF